MQTISLQMTKDSDPVEYGLIDKTADFLLLIGPKRHEPSKGELCYLLYNAVTGVFEAEGFSEMASRLVLKEQQAALIRVRDGLSPYPQPDDALVADGYTGSLN